jgi:ubiquitin-activating enzyme E1
MTNDCSFNPQDAFIGGVVGQEVIKAITGKFMPITQMFYNDSIEIVNQELFSADW